ncbi:MAG: cyclic peptide export ABC transporter [Pseudomonadota bacterium]
MNLLSYLYRQSWKVLLFASVAGMIGGLSGAALVALIGKGIGGGEPLAALAWSFFGLCLVSLAGKAYSEIALLKLTQEAIFSLRVDISRKLLATPLTKLQDLGKHGLLVILTKDIDTFIQAFQFLPMAFGNGVIIISCLAYMAWLSWQLFAMFVLCLVVCLIAYAYAERWPVEQLSKVRGQMDTLYRHFRNLVEGSKELQLNARRGQMYVDQVIAPGAQDFKSTYVGAMGAYVWVANIGTMLFYVIIGMLLFVVPRWLPQQAVTLTTMTVVLLYLIKPIGEMISSLPPMRQAGIALEKIMQLDGALTGEAIAPAPSDPFSSQGELRLQLNAVCHHYPGAQDDSRFMLGPLNVTLEQGEIVFIVGGNGSGKTTLAMLLLGLYQPESGTLSLNGVTVDAASAHAYRQHFSAVFADFHLFEELLGGETGELGARAAHYVELLEMGHKVKVVDGKFSSIALSTGQRKRLALVAAYLEDRPVYLFDEWAADQDPSFKRIFYTELLPDLKARGKLVIVISHDDGYFTCADRIIKLVDGQLHHQGRDSEPARPELQVA